MTSLLSYPASSEMPLMCRFGSLCSDRRADAYAATWNLMVATAVSAPYRVGAWSGPRCFVPLVGVAVW